MTLIATATLAGAVVFPFLSGYRVEVCVVVSLAAIVLAARSLSEGKIIWTLLFLSALGVFTPFQIGHFPDAFVSMFDMVTLALFALAPLAFRRGIPVPKSTMAIHRPSFTNSHDRS
jgi:hypothetical protein